MSALWRRLVAFGFRLLYNELAWLYDPVSWITSLGRWRRWQRAALAYLPAGGRVLEVAAGPGHLLADLATAGYQVAGLDLSPAMLRQARRRLAGRRLTAVLCRGRAGALPFADGTFDAVVLTFPTPFVYQPASVANLARVLREPGVEEGRPGGRLIVVEQAYFRRRDPAARVLEWAYRITGQRGRPPDLPALLAAAGLDARRASVEVEGTTVGLVIADKAGSRADG
ncbi:MAG: methyltransferase domain-containing protein [Anaerolineae bacterium]